MYDTLNMALIRFKPSKPILIIETVALTCNAANMQATVLQNIKHPVKARNIANDAMRACTTALRKVLTHLQARPSAISHTSLKRGCANHILQCRSLDYQQWGISNSVLGRLYGDSISVIGFRRASICGWPTCQGHITYTWNRGKGAYHGA